MKGIFWPKVTFSYTPGRVSCLHLGCQKKWRHKTRLETWGAMWRHETRLTLKIGREGHVDHGFVLLLGSNCSFLSEITWRCYFSKFINLWHKNDQKRPQKPGNYFKKWRHKARWRHKTRKLGAQKVETWDAIGDIRRWRHEARSGVSYKTPRSLESVDVPGHPVGNRKIPENAIFPYPVSAIFMQFRLESTRKKSKINKFNIF